MRRVIPAFLAFTLLSSYPAVPGIGAETKPPDVPAAADAEAPPGAPGVPEEYRIGSEDLLRISVWDNKELTQDVVVRPDGKISLPLLQDVDAEGRTAPELGIEISRRLTAFVKEPQVSVILLQVNAPKVYVLGNVVRPGTYPLRGSMTVLQALSIAGGMTPFADTSAIRVVRKAEDGKQKVRKVNFRKLIDDNGRENYSLKAGDTIVVP